MFDHIYFVSWMQKLLDFVQEQGITGAIIVMDNAKYHKKLADDVPRSSWSKSRLQEACAWYNIDHI